MTAWRSIPRSIALFALLALPLFFGACSAKAPVLELDQNWKVTFSDSRDYAAPGFDDRTWQTINLPAKLSTEKKRQTIWLRNTFSIPPELRDKELALYLGKIWDADRTYLNGELVGSTGSEPPDYFAAWNFDRNYRLPASVLHRDKPNVIAIRVYTGQLALFNGHPILGEADNMAKHSFYAELKARYLALAGGVLTLIFGLISFIRFLFDHKDKPSLLYAIMSFLWSVQSLHFVLPDFGISYNAHDKIYYIIMAAEVLCIYKFLEVFLGKKHKILSVAVYVISAISVIICFTATDNSPMMGWRSDVIGAIGLLIQVFWLATILMAIRKTEARIILGAYIIFMITLGHDALAISGAISYDFFWMNLGYPAVIIAFGAILALQAVLTAQELAVAHDQLRDYANHLEEKVEDRTRQLSEAKEEIEAAMHELEAMNDNLIRTNRDLEDAQRIAAMDMRMAAQVQRSFFPPNAPPSPEWQAALLFRPMAGVSGDLYDFYQKDGRLTGLSLFDVSGHGIASGLITLLARSVIFRVFMEAGNERLGEVLQKINTQLIEELGGIDNYLTGILLRINNDVMEYVNAGHTDLLLRREGKSRSMIVKPKDRDIKGHFLGLDMMQNTFESISFKVKKGDTLLLYSDCAIETHNRKGEEFGVDRLCEVFDSMPEDYTPSDLLSEIVHRLEEHAGAEGFKDDLTMIILKRLG